MVIIFGNVKLKLVNDSWIKKSRFLTEIWFIHLKLRNYPFFKKTLDKPCFFYYISKRFTYLFSSFGCWIFYFLWFLAIEFHCFNADNIFTKNIDPLNRNSL